MTSHRGRGERLLYSQQNLENSRQNLGSSRRSLISISESESEVGSLLSGLSQARRIPDRRKLPQGKSSGRGGLRSNPGSSSAANNSGLAAAAGGRRPRPPTRDSSTTLKQKHENYKKDVKKIITIQAFARGYIARFAYQSQLTMERTKKKFFAIQIQAHVRGFLQRQRYCKVASSRPKVERKKSPLVKKTTPKMHAPTGLSSPKQNSRRPLRSAPAPPKTPVIAMGSDSERSEISIRMLALHRNTDRLASFHTVDRLGDSQSDVGSVMSNLSVARKLPDRRKKREEREKKVIKIQAVARGYIQRILYRSILAMENTKKNYGAITIQANVRGHLQRVKGPNVSRKHVAPPREQISTETTRKKSEPITRDDGDESTSDSQKKVRKTTKSRKDGNITNSKPNHESRKGESNTYKNMRKPMRHRSNNSGGENNLPPRQLTIRKPMRHQSESDEESRNVPLRNLTIRKPRRHHSDSEESDNEPPKRLTIRAKNTRRNERPQSIEIQSPPRKVMLRVKKPRRQAADSESEQSLELEKANQASRRERLMSLGGASDSRFGESESDVASLMSGLSQARKVPDRRHKQSLRNSRAPKREHPRSHDKVAAANVSSAIKIQAVGRGYIQRFAFKSRHVMEQTKKKFFVIQIQALARGFVARSKLPKGHLEKLRRKK